MARYPSFPVWSEIYEEWWVRELPHYKSVRFPVVNFHNQGISGHLNETWVLLAEKRKGCTSPLQPAISSLFMMNRNGGEVGVPPSYAWGFLSVFSLHQNPLENLLKPISAPRVSDSVVLRQSLRVCNSNQVPR